MKKHFRNLFVLLTVLSPWLASALVSTSEVGTWPASWPSELESLRKQARTVGVATGIQQDIHEIKFTNRAEFSNAWPALLKIKTPGAPVTLYWTNSPPPRSWGSLLATNQAMVRIYAPTGGFTGGPSSGEPRTGEAVEKLLQEGKMLKAGPPWPAGITRTNGTLPEFVKAKEVNSKLEWVSADPNVEFKAPTGFFHRARVDLDLVVDGVVIDLTTVHLPRETLVHSDLHPIPELTGAQRIALVSEAHRAFSDHVKGDPKDRSHEISKRFWGPTILNLKPLRVVDDRVNIKIVMAEGGGVEAGFYVNLPISSFAPGEEYFLECVSLSQPEDHTFGSLSRYKMVYPVGTLQEK